MASGSARLALALLIAAIATGGLFDAAEKNSVVYEKPPQGVMNEFRFIGNALACISDKPNPALGLDPCLHIGPIFLGADIDDIQAILGKSYQVARKTADMETRVYALVGRGPMLPYFAIDVRDGRAIAVQLTGEDTTEYSFAGVALRARKKQVRAMLGPPSSTKDVAEVGAVLWSYSPFPISLELKNSRVYSIRIYKP